MAGHEIEVKLRNLGADALLKAGLALEVETPRHFEDNWLLDTDEQRLSKQRSILRVRVAGGRGWLTYKESAGTDAPASQFKLRVEIETQLSAPEQAVEIFARLGYRKFFRYQKYRTVYRVGLPGFSAPAATLHAMLDETPIGNFAELEGAEEAIAEAVRRLGITPADYILDSYLALQINHCQAQGKPLEDLVFEHVADAE